ncbi:hypothetical protein D5086_023144 [Populus alba]|uniref:Uncharacterized protein n=3 Tax=Populus TaxID=3689 RepID=A0ACC4BAR6_POPAL|nr:hypothetical protein NC653_029093 [Populus alba x Populus x berolinensis]TKR63954.1 hypothetical protein D5086_0000320580 [Populus alba]
MNSIKVSGAKRSFSIIKCYESSISGALDFCLVYVCGKSEAEVGKLSHPEETARPKRPKIKESTVSSFPALAPVLVAPPIISSGKPLVPLTPGQSSTRFPAESSYHPAASLAPSSSVDFIEKF